MSDGKYMHKCVMCRRIYKSEKDFLMGTSRWRICGAQNLWFDCNCGATLVLKKGEYPWYSPDIGMTDEARSIFNTLTSLKQLPYIPHSIMKLQQLIKQDNVTSRQLADAAKYEPIIAGNVLRIANRLIQFRESGTIKSLEHAISYIGLKSFAELIVMASVQSFQLTCCHFKHENFWAKAFLTGRVAESLAGKFAPQLIADEVYLAGTLCNVGKLVTAICLPETADKIAMDEADPKLILPWIQGERKHGAPSHQVLGEIAASLWGFPDFVIQAARYHHKARHETPGAPSRLLEIVTFANQVSHWLNLEPTKIDTELFQTVAAKFGFTTESQLDAFVGGLMPLTKVQF